MRHSAKREIGGPGERARSGAEKEPPFSELDISLHSIPHLGACSQVTGRHAKEISRVIARDFFENIASPARGEKRTCRNSYTAMLSARTLLREVQLNKYLAKFFSRRVAHTRVTSRTIFVARWRRGGFVKKKKKKKN